MAITEFRYYFQILSETGGIIIGRGFNGRDGIKRDHDTISEVRMVLLQHFKNVESTIPYIKRTKSVDDLKVRFIVIDKTIIMDEHKQDQIVINESFNLGGFCPKVRFKIDFKPIVNEIYKTLRK